MKKEEVFVPVESKEQALKFKSVLEAMGQKIAEDAFEYSVGNQQGKEGGLYLYDNTEWAIAVTFGKTNERTQITFGQLIDLLSEPVKIAVKVENESEFKALMNFYNSKAYTSAHAFKYFPKKRVEEDGMLLITFENDFIYPHYNFGNILHLNPANYKIIHFADFAKEHNIKVPLLVSEDGVELFEDSEVYVLWKEDIKESDIFHYSCLKDKDGCWNISVAGQIAHTNRRFLFSTSEAALSWIEKQNAIQLGNDITATITDAVHFSQPITSLSKDQVKKIYDRLK